MRLECAAVLLAGVVGCGLARPAAETLPPDRSSTDRGVASAVVAPTTPPARAIVDSSYRYVGRQTIRLFGNADAEQHMFVIADPAGGVRRFCWIQFEHFLPTNAMRYDYQTDRSAALGDLRFMYDVKGWADYRVTTTDSGSDGQPMARLLASRGLTFPRRAARVRLFYFPDVTRRSEIMVIYGEALDDTSAIPVAPNGVGLDAADSASARLILSHALSAIAFRVR